MIYVEVYTHSSVIDGSISFEESDLRVSSIRDNETLVKKILINFGNQLMKLKLKIWNQKNGICLASKEIGKMMVAAHIINVGLS